MRASLLCSLLVLVACDTQGTVTIGGGDTDVTGGGGGSTNGTTNGSTSGTTDGTTNGTTHGGANGTTNGGTGGDTDAGTPGDTDLDPFGPDPVAWDGERTFTFVPYTGKPCSLTVVEAGEQVYGAGHLQLERACPPCQRVFEVPIETKGLCITSGFPTSVYRGLEFQGGGNVRIWSLSQSGAKWSASVLATGTVAGDTITYAYKDKDVIYKRVDVTGTVTLK